MWLDHCVSIDFLNIFRIWHLLSPLIVVQCLLNVADLISSEQMTISSYTFLIEL